MNLRQALIEQSPSLALQRAAADEIARLDDLVQRLRSALCLQTCTSPEVFPDLHEDNHG